jgi:hypothetical protein
MAPILAESHGASAAACRKNCAAGRPSTVNEKKMTPAMRCSRAVRCYNRPWLLENSMSLSPSTRAPLPSQVLRDSLLSTIDLLDRRRAAEIGDAVIDDYVALNWLEWNGGALRLTVIGQNIRQQLLANLERP